MNNENIMYTKQAFKCGICGKEYECAIDRARCELNCYQKQQEEMKKAAEAKKKAEQAARKEEVDAAIQNAQDLLTQYTKDYGHYSVTSNNIVDDLYRLLFW